MKKLARGFTLIELMIVVAIIGILASIAVPNFLKFQARARQSEVKGNLKALYTAIKSNAAEKGTYLCGLCGFAPEPGNRYSYFAAAAGTAVREALSSTSTTCKSDPGNTAATDPTASTPGSFKAAGVGNIDNDGTCDTWTIDDQNVLSNTTNDVDG